MGKYTKPPKDKAKDEPKKEEVKKDPHKGMIKADGKVYYAQKKCYFGVTMYKKGHTLKVAAGEYIPHHFGHKKPEKEEDDII